MAVVPEARFQVVGNGDGVVAVGQIFEAPAHDEPGAADSEYFAEHNPERLHADDGAHAGEAEKEPGGLAGGAGGECDGPETEALSAGEVVSDVAHSTGGQRADDQERGEVGDDSGDLPCHARGSGRSGV